MTESGSSSDPFCSVQFKMVSMRLEMSTPSPKRFPNVAFETVPEFVWLMRALFRSFKEDQLELHLSTILSSRRSKVLGFVPAGTVSKSSTLHIFREASHL